MALSEKHEVNEGTQQQHTYWVKPVFSTKTKILLSYKEDDMIYAKKLSTVFFVVIFLFFVLAASAFAESLKQGTSLSPKPLQKTVVPSQTPLAETFVPPKMSPELKVTSRVKKSVKQDTTLKIPDLVLESITVDKRNAGLVPDVIKVTATVTNSGTVPSPSCHIRYDLGLFNSQTPQRYYSIIPALEAGESVTLEGTCWFYIKGYYKLAAFADGFGVVNELNENNNYKELPMPPIQIQ